MFGRSQATPPIFTERQNWAAGELAETKAFVLAFCGASIIAAQGIELGVSHAGSNPAAKVCIIGQPDICI